MVIVTRGIVYFSIVFAAGFVLGTVRVLWLVPQVGERLAELLEAPLMLAVIFVSARFVTQRFPASHPLDYIVSGVIALVLLLALEFSVVLGLRGLSISQYMEERDPVAGAVYALMLVVFAVMPWLAGNRRER